MFIKDIADYLKMLYNYIMLSPGQKAFAAIIVIFIIFAGCAKQPVNEPVEYMSGPISFINTSFYPITLNFMIQSRGGTRETRILQRNVAGNGGRYSFQNIIDGGTIFPGGDDVTIEFQSTSPSPDDPTRPLFIRTIVLTVNGAQNIWVKGQNGEYEIGGN